MIKPLLEQLRIKVEQAQGMKDTTKSDLLKLVAEIESKTAGNATISSAEGQQHADKLSDHVEELEVSHPEITALVNRITTMLGDLGV